MNASELRDHLEKVHASYRALVEGNRLEDLDRELVANTWMPSRNGSAPSEIVIEATNQIMASLRSAVAKGDKRAARGALDSLRRLIRMIEASESVASIRR